jgi:hypothetical protein
VVGTKKDLVTEESRKKNDPSKIQEFADKVVRFLIVSCQITLKHSLFFFFTLPKGEWKICGMFCEDTREYHSSFQHCCFAVCRLGQKKHKEK